MRFRSQTWLLLGLLLLAGIVLWRMSEQPVVKNSHLPAAPGPASTATTSAPLVTKSIAAIRAASRVAKPAATNAPNRLAYRLANTTKTVNQLAHSERAILLENALIDTSSGGALDIPAHLRAQGDPGTYIVQSRGPLEDAFRAQLAAAGATIVSYIPENAYLVRVSASGAGQLAALPQTQSVVAYEPYFKINSALLPLAVKQTPLPEGAMLRLLLFADDRAATREKIEALGAEIVAEDRSPFGPVVTVRAPVDALVALAGLSGVQRVELFQQLKLANDLSRVTMGVTLTTLSNEVPYLNLTGSNVLVAVVDSGVDATHPDLSPRVLGDVASSLVDFDGHGTHVAGIIAASGLKSPTLTNASGSVPGADFRGKAPQARIFALPSGAGNINRSDSYLQETAYRTNVFIANNSWGVPGENGYDLMAASYDAAVRDALPTVTGSQPLVYVFVAGNTGGGTDGNGQGGQADSLWSPATAKNVIAVGQLEQARNITNKMTNIVLTGSVFVTNVSQPFSAETDSKTEVADTSSRGNVGVGVEGDFGRFKPDVVAPGKFVVSTASRDLDQIAYYNPTNSYTIPYPDFVLTSTGSVADVIFIPQNTVSLRLQIVPNFRSTLPLPSLPIFADPGIVPVTFKGSNDVTLTFAFPGEVAQDWFFGVKNPTTNTIHFDIIATLITTNDNGTYFQVLSNLNQKLGKPENPTGHPWYRYESGTSMAAAGVSGVLALMQQFFENYATPKVRPSPAMMKALLINGARSPNELYDFHPRAPINYQGWGAVQLRSSLPGALSNFASHAASPMQIYDQNPADALVTGQRRTRNIKLTADAVNAPLRVTLVWTDPPGNPSAGIKLVNDLDLIVTNRDTGEIYYGNDIVSGRDFNSPSDTNSPPNSDFVNNVENIYLQQPLTGTNFSVTVVGRRVNVNAVTAHPNDVAQDYALVIASGSGEIAGAILPPTDLGNAPLPDGRLVTAIISNGVPLLDQHVGANTPLLGTTNGITNQWHFYIYTNNTTFTNVAFVTFLPPTLAIPREGVFQGEPTKDEKQASRPEADIDLYASSNPALTNLDPAAIAGAKQSRERGGTESIVFSNATQNQVFYIGVKSEDFEGAGYGFLGVSSEQPFGETDAAGNQILRGVPVPQIIPDGSPEHPGAAIVICISTSPAEVRRVIVTNSVSHELFGDLFGNLSHDGKFAVLNNHTGVNGQTNVTLIYDDFGQGDIPGSRPSDGPGSLRNFVGEKSSGVWLFTMVDNAPGATGQINNFTIKLEPKKETNSVTTTILPGGIFYDFVRVPVEATNLIISVGGVTGPQSLGFFLSRNDFPSLTSFDYSTNIPVPGRSFVFNRSTTPILQPGLYVYAIFNPPGNPPQTVTIITTLQLDLNGVKPIQFNSVGNEPLFDDMVNYSSINVTNQERIVTTEVGLRIDHPRVSDLAVTLVSPRGTRVLLVENRGGLDTNGFGSTIIDTNIFNVTANGTALPNTNFINIGKTSGTFPITYNFYTEQDQMTVYYGTNVTPANLILDTGFTNNPPVIPGDLFPGSNTIPQTVIVSFPPPGVPATNTYLTIVINQFGNTNQTAWTYTAGSFQTNFNYFTLTEYTNKTTTPIKFVPPPFTATSNTAKYALPEETLDKLKGEFAKVGTNGTWKLELWDNRVGAPAPAGALKSWQLSFVFENTPVPPTPPTGPIVPPIPPQFVNELQPMCITNIATPLDPGNTLSFFWVTNPGPASISAPGIICWTPTECQGPGTYTFTYRVQDNHVPPRNTTNTFTVTVREVNVAPVLPSQSNRVVSALSLMVVTNTATDADCPTNSLTYMKGNVWPAGANINPTNGIITWTPGAQHVGGTFTFTTIVTDLNTNNPINSPQLSATNTFTVTVKTGVTVFGGPGDWSGVGIRYFNGAIYLCGNSTAVGGFAGSFAVPLFPNSTPAWLTNWPVADARDSFYGITTTSNAVYVAGPDYTRTVDGSGLKDTKGLVVKFPFTGPTGAGFNGAIWDQQTPVAPGTFGFEGVEGLNATLGVNEGGINYIYATGNSQSGAANPGRLYLSKLDEAGNILWTQNDGALAPSSSGRGLAALNGSVYVAGVIAGQPYLRKYDSASALTWSRTRPLSGVYNGVAIISNYVYAVGSTGTGTNTDFLVEKWDLNGNLLYTRTFDHFALNQDALNGVVGVVRRVFCVGYTRGATAGGADAALLEIDPGTGTLLSTVLIGEGLDDIFNGIDTDVTNSLYMIGESRSYSGTGTNQVMLVQYPMPPIAAFSIGSVTVTNNTVQLQWVAPTYEIFQVQWSSNLFFWNAFTNVISSLNGTFNFTDDGSQTGGLGPYRFYRLLLLP